MKVLAVMGSPHRGNGLKIVQAIEAELKQRGPVEFSYLFLSDADFKMCKGCFTCFSRGESLCPLKDDKEKIELEILSADGVILSSPGYVWNVSGLMKNFLDRFAWSLHRPKFFGQSLFLVANGGSGVGKTVKALSLALGGSTIAARLAVISTPWKPTASYARKTGKMIRRQTGLFYGSMLSGKERPVPFGNLIWFSMFKKMAALSKEGIPADYEFYREKTAYFYPAKVGFIQSRAARLIAAAAVWTLKRQVEFK